MSNHYTTILSTFYINIIDNITTTFSIVKISKKITKKRHEHDTRFKHNGVLHQMITLDYPTSQWLSFHNLQIRNISTFRNVNIYVCAHSVSFVFVFIPFSIFLFLFFAYDTFFIVLLCICFSVVSEIEDWISPVHSIWIYTNIFSVCLSVYFIHNIFFGICFTFLSWYRDDSFWSDFISIFFLFFFFCSFSIILLTLFSFHFV